MQEWSGYTREWSLGHKLDAERRNRAETSSQRLQNDTLQQQASKTEREKNSTNRSATRQKNTGARTEESARKSLKSRAGENQSSACRKNDSWERKQWKPDRRFNLAGGNDRVKTEQNENVTTALRRKRKSNPVEIATGRNSVTADLTTDERNADTGSRESKPKAKMRIAKPKIENSFRGNLVPRCSLASGKPGHAWDPGGTQKASSDAAFVGADIHIEVLPHDQRKNSGKTGGGWQKLGLVSLARTPAREETEENEVARPRLEDWNENQRRTRQTWSVKTDF
jgi:hypothetical protein